MSVKRVIRFVKSYNLRDVRMSLEKATERYKNGSCPWYPETRTSKAKKKRELLDGKDSKRKEI